MTTQKITSTLGTVQNSIETAWNRIVMGVRTRKMPKTLKRVKQTLKGNKNTELSSHWDHTERENDILSKTTFYPNYMGSTLVEELVNPEPGANYHNTGISTKALERIIKMSRNKNLVSVSVTICPKGIQVIRLNDRSILLDVAMDRVSFCTNDKKYGKVTAFIAKNYVNGTMECYAFLCNRQRMAKAIADKLSTAFVKSKEILEQHTTNKRTEEPMEGDNSTSESYNNGDLISEVIEGNNSSLIDCGQNEPNVEVQLRVKKATKVTGYEENHNLVLLSESSTGNHQTNDNSLIDDDLQPVMRQRADSDSWAVMVSGPHDNSSSTDLELEFSNFARSRSTTNLTDLHTSVYSAWDI